MVDSHHRFNPELVASVNHGAIVQQLGFGEATFYGFDACPLDTESIHGQTRVGEQPDILAIAVVAVCGITGWFAHVSTRRVLARPPVAGGIIALDLVTSSSGTPNKVFRKYVI